MMTFIFGGDNSRAISNLLQMEGDIKCAVAFLGERVVELISDRPERVKIICNIESGATNPAAVERLVNVGVKVKSNRNLHTKVYLALDEKAIVGSANASANGLSYEDDEVIGWMEASIQTDDKKVLSDINEWFDSQWELSDEITPEAIGLARDKWRRRRNQREFSANGNYESILDLLREHPEQLRDRNIYIAIHRSDNANPEVVARFEAICDEQGIGEVLDFWEDWSELPENAHYISIYYGPRGGFRFCGYFYVPDNKDDFIEEVRLDGGESSELLIYFRRNSIDGMTINAADEDLLRGHIDELWSSQDPAAIDEAVYLSLWESRDILYP